MEPINRAGRAFARVARVRFVAFRVSYLGYAVFQPRRGPLVRVKLGR